MVNFTSTGEPAAILQGRQIAALASAQHGVIARRQLLALGLGRGAIDWRLQCRRLESIHRGIYIVGGAQPNVRTRWLAAVLACGDGATLSHRSAAALWGLCADRGPTDVTSTHGRPGRRGIRLHRSVVPLPQLTVRSRIPVTTVARTLIDLAGRASVDELEAAWEEADRLSLLHIADVEQVPEGLPPRREILRLIGEARLAGSTSSPLEERFMKLCRAHGLPLPATNALLH